MAGTYTEITLVAPENAAEGETVSIEAKVKNLHTGPIYITVTGNINGVAVHFGGVYHNVAAGATQPFYQSFIMPAGSVRVTAWSFYYGADGLWREDDESYVNIALSEVPVEKDAAIVEKWLSYNAARYTIPVTDVPQGEPVRIGARVRNDSSTDEKLGMSWTVTDPNGNIIGEGSYSHYEVLATAPGDTQDFWAPGFYLNQIGEHRIRMNLFIYPESATPVDYYEGVLCTIKEVEVPPNISGRFTKDDGQVQLYDPNTGTWSTARPTAQPGQPIKIRVEVQNKSNVNADMKLVSRFRLDSQELSNPDALSYNVPPEQYRTLEVERIVPETGLTGVAEVACSLYARQAGTGGWSTTPVDEKSYHWANIIIAPVDGDGDGVGLILIQDYIYPYAAQHVGNVEECTFVFSLLPEQMPGTEWFKDQIINVFTDKVEAEGAKMIKLQVYEDTTPTFTTDYKVIATATASPLPWALIIVGVLAILFLIALSYTIIQIRTFLWGEEGAPSGFGDIILLMVVVMMMGMMMDGMPGITEKVKEYVPKIGRRALKEAKELVKGE